MVSGRVRVLGDLRLGVLRTVDVNWRGAIVEAIVWELLSKNGFMVVPISWSGIMKEMFPSIDLLAIKDGRAYAVACVLYGSKKVLNYSEYRDLYNKKKDYGLEPVLAVVRGVGRDLYRVCLVDFSLVYCYSRWCYLDPRVLDQEGC